MKHKLHSKLTKDEIMKLDVGQTSLGGGLIVDVTASTKKGAAGDLNRAYLFRWTAGDGKRREVKIADCIEIAPSAAMKTATDWRQLVREGKDPRFVRKAATGVTFKAFVEEHVAEWSRGLNATEPYAWKNMLDAVPSLHDMTLASIDLDHIADALRPLFAKKPKVATRHRWRIETALNAASVMKHRQGDNPAAWRLLKHMPGFRVMAKAANVRVNHASMPYADLPAFMHKLSYEDVMSVRCMEVAILTATRSQEARLMEWSQLDLDRGIWTIPAGNMKARKVHTVPLSRQVIALLRKLEAGKRGSFVFGSTHVFGHDKPMTAQTLLQHLKTLIPGLTLHGFRATFRNWAGENRIEEHEMLEFCLAHVVGVGASDRYLNSACLDRRRAVMQAWADYALPVKGDNVVPLSPRKAA
jgi:integrase